MKSSIIRAIILLTMCAPILAFGQDAERLFCSTCGNHSKLKSSFCFECGHRLDKTALVSRLKARLAKADSLQQPVLFTLDEISVLMEHEVESRAKGMMRSGGLARPSRPKGQMEKTLDVVFPIIVGSAAIYFLGQTLYQTH